MNNLPYDVLQFFWFPLSIICAKIGIVLHNLFSSRKRFLCSELIAKGFYKERDYLFGKSVENILPADFDSPELFEEARDIWLFAPRYLLTLRLRSGSMVSRVEPLIFCSFSYFTSQYV